MVLFSGRLDELVEGVTITRKTLRIIRENIGWALGYNAIALPLAVSGYVQPWMAALGMSASSLVVVTNSLRLRRAPSERRGQAAPAAARPAVAPAAGAGPDAVET
jgi:Cu2+-exporting ATPase